MSGPSERQAVQSVALVRTGRRIYHLMYVDLSLNR